jgi:Flp pilus assembly protein TadG
MKTAFKRAHRWEAGGALVELAFFSTTLVLMVAGAIDFGKFNYDGIILANAAEAGVLYGSENYTGTAADISAMETAATNDANGLSVSPTATEFCTCYNGASATSVGSPISCSTGTCATGYHELQFVQVVTSSTFTPLIKYFRLPASITLTRTAVMEVTP